jgi:hypothetical protein
MKMRNLLRTAALTAATLLLWTGVGWGQALLVEDFDYPLGNLLTDNGWVGHSGTGTNNIVTTAPTISYSGYISSGVGNEVTLLATGQDVHKTFTAQNTGSVYAVLLAKVTATSTTGDYFFHLGPNTIGTNFRGRLFVKKDASDNLAFGIAHSGTANYSQFDYALNQVYLIVLKYTFVSGAANDVVSIYINPTPGSSEPSSGWITNTDTPTDPIDIGAVALRQGTAGNLVNAIVDGIRVATTWAEAVKASGGDTTPPVPTFNPANGATDVVISVHPTITFNEPVRNIDNSEITSANIYSLLGLLDGSMNFLPFTASIDAEKKVITIVPTSNLGNGQLHTISLSKVEDFNNNEMPSNVITTFTTIAAATPTITLTSTHTGPYYAGDEDVTVTWTSANIETVVVQAWVPSEGEWITMASAAGATGTASFNIPLDAQYSTAYKLRVKPSDADTPVSESATFKVRAVAMDLETVRGYLVNDEFRFDGTAIVTFTRPAGAPGYNQKFIVDATAGMLIHDPNPIVITTPYAIGDGISGLVARRAVFNQLVQIVPLADPGAPVSTGNEIVPEVKTLSTITSADQGKLVKVYGVNFSSGGSFSAGQNYTITDASKGSMFFRTQFAEADYIGQPVPSTPLDLIMLVGQYNADLQLSARSMADMELYPQLIVIGGDANGVVSSSDGYYSEGQEITVTAYPFEGYLFHNWTDGDMNVVSTDNPYTFNMPASDLTLIGNFRAIVNGTIDPNQLTFYENWDNGIFTTTITWGDATEVTGMSYYDLGEELWVPLPTTMWEVIDDNGTTATLNIDLAQAPDKMQVKAKGEHVVGTVPWRAEFDLGAPAMGETLLTLKTFMLNLSVEDMDENPITNATIVVTPFEDESNPGFVWDETNNPIFEIAARGDYHIAVSAPGFEDAELIIYNVESDINQVITLADAAPTEYIVTFEVVDGINGNIRAFANSIEIWSGNNVAAGSDVLFEAYPWWGYMVKEWKVNGTVVEGYVVPEYTYSNLQSDIHVTVEFEPFVYPEIQPEEQLFSTLDPADVEFEVIWGSESEITGIDYSYWTDEDDQVIVPLVEGVDYTLVGNTLTISQNFIENNYQNVGDWMNFVAKFGMGSEVYFYVVVVYSTSPIFIPSEVAYDLTNPSDVFTNILWAEAEEIVSVKVNGVDLVVDVDYHIDGSWFFVHNSYLSPLLLAVDDEVAIDVEFDTEDVATLTITAIESGIINATINPTSVTYIEVMPDYQDITITWNDASEVTGLNVKLNFGFGFEEFEWPFYEVTENGDGTANLRIFFDEAKKKASKEEVYIQTVLVTISFDAGAPAYFFLTSIQTYYYVTGIVNPEEAGWINGDYDYSAGEEVELWANANWNYRFVNWTDSEGTVLSSNNPYIFTMPAQDITVYANFERVYYIHFSVIEIGEGIIYINDAVVTLGGVTNEPGDYQFQMPVGNYTYFVTKEGYLTVTGTVNVVDEDIEITVFLVAGTNPTYTVTFAIADGESNPITDAVVTFNGVAGGVGEYAFTDVEPGVYSYSVTKDGFVSFAGTVTVTDEDVTVPVTLTLVGVNTNTFANFSAYPNPFSTTINLSNPAVVSRVYITNIIGQRVMDVATNGAGNVETATLPAGIYLVTFEAASGERTVRKMVKK